MTKCKNFGISEVNLRLMKERRYQAKPIWYTGHSEATRGCSEHSSTATTTSDF